MSTKTTNLNLDKPEIGDTVNTTITQLGSNFDIIDESLAEIASYYITQISGAVTTNNGEYTINNSALLTFLNANPNVEVYFPKGKYHLTSSLTFLYGVSLRLHRNAEIVADNTMSFMFSFDNSNQNPITRWDHILHQYVTGGTINGNDKANIAIQATRYMDFNIKDITIKNTLNKGILSQQPCAELKVDNVYLVNDNYLNGTVNNVSDNIAIDVQSTDNYIHNVTIVSYSTGVKISQGGNYLDKVHYWVDQGGRIPSTVAFDVTVTGWAKFSYCVADTAQICFRNAQSLWLDHCQFLYSNTYNSYFSGTPIGVYLVNGFNVTSVKDCAFQESGVGFQAFNQAYSLYDGRIRVQDVTYWGNVTNIPVESYVLDLKNFTPNIIGSTTAGTPTYITQYAAYTKMGRNVTFQVNIKATLDNTISGDLQITGLPFTSTNGQVACSIGYKYGLINDDCVIGAVLSQDTKIGLWGTNKTNTAPVWSDGVRGQTVEIWISGTYFTYN